MTLQTTAPPQTMPPRWQFTVEEYDRMTEAGVFGPEDRLELIEGEILAMSPINARHAAAVIRLDRLLQKHLGETALISTQNPIYLGKRSEPQPDVMALHWRNDYYAQSHPRPADVFLVVEVCDSTLAYDREVKVPLYARHGVPEVWLVNLNEGYLEVFRHPIKTGYGEQQTFGPQATVAPLAFPAVGLAVAEILGK